MLYLENPMSLGLQIGLGVGIPLLLIVIFLIIVLKKRKKDLHPLHVRAEEMMVMITQRIHSLNRRIQKSDVEVTELLLAQKEEDLSVTKMEISLEEIPNKVESLKAEIEESIADIKDLKEYREEIKLLINEKGEKDWKKIEEFLDFVREKMQYRFT
jgi:peptidoglycan hydrolase CwlO-like protein